MSLANLLMSCVPARQAKVTELSHKIHATDNEQSAAYALRTSLPMLQVLCHLNDLSRVEDYLRVVGRLHDSAGVEIAYLAVTGDAFCTSLKVQSVQSMVRPLFITMHAFRVSFS